MSYAGAELNRDVALWGYDIDYSLNLVTGLWISDSDSIDINSNFLIPLAWYELTSRWFVTGGEFASWTLEGIDVFYAPAIPEPSYAGILLLIGAASVAVRRRRNSATTVTIESRRTGSSLKSASTVAPPQGIAALEERTTNARNATVKRSPVSSRQSNITPKRLAF